MIHWSMSSVSAPLSTSTVLWLRQLTPLQSEQDIEHSNSCARQEHLFVLQSLWHLHRISSKSSSGAGSFTIPTGHIASFRTLHPHSKGLLLNLIVAVEEMLRGGIKCNWQVFGSTADLPDPTFSINVLYQSLPKQSTALLLYSSSKTV